MAHDTPVRYKNLVLYEVYVRNHGPSGEFADVEADLPRIKALGVDVIWFMPIHPIGKMNKKGGLGSPYSIADYREVNPEYGGRADFAQLIERAHELGLKVMIDVVYNHTAHDAVLVREHPEWYHQNADGMPITTVRQWSDVIDLVHPNPALADYLVETLQMWAEFGIDGFRCDVASLLPLGFWQHAREAVAEVKREVIWLAESVSAAWVAERRAAGYATNSDGELYRAFDLTYDYDIWPIFRAAVKGQVPVARYLEMLRFQDCIYPANFVKMRCVENHDQPRIMALAKSREQALAWTAFQAFNKGAFLIYAGQEAGATRTPSLFDIDKVAWGDYTFAPFLTRLAQTRKHPAHVDGQFVIMEAEPAVQAAWVHPGETLYGVFNMGSSVSTVDVQLPDGEYVDLLGDAAVHVQGGQMPMPESAVIVVFEGDAEFQAFSSALLDHEVH
jgi:glycosidase